MSTSYDLKIGLLRLMFFNLIITKRYNFFNMFYFTLIDILHEVFGLIFANSLDNTRIINTINV